MTTYFPFATPKQTGNLLALILLSLTLAANSQNLPKTLILTGNGNVPTQKNGYPPWIHEFQNEMITAILQRITTVDVVDDWGVLTPEHLQQYDLIISNSIFMTPTDAQLNALYQFVSEGKSYLTVHCGILSLLNWDRYEEFMGGIFIGGPSTVPSEFKVTTANIEFWGYPYSFRNEPEHPVSIVVDDFVTHDELYYFQPNTRDFHVIARAENLPVMWWHPVGKGKVMSLTLGHDAKAKSNPGYQDLLKHGVQWLLGAPLIHGAKPTLVSNRELNYRNFMALKADVASNSNEKLRFGVIDNTHPEVFRATTSSDGVVDLTLGNQLGSGKFVASAQGGSRSSDRAFEVTVVRDGMGNIASYYGNSITGSSVENSSALFSPDNLIDNDTTTRWSSAAVDSASIVIDLKKNYPVSKIVLSWEASFAKRYALEGSTDGKRWRLLASVLDGDGGKDSHEFGAVPVRYVRLKALERANKRWGYSLYEIEIYQGK